MRINRETKIIGATLAGIIAVCTMIAAVPGIFSYVNSTSGYLVNGSAGSSGQALCSDGSYYNTPCSFANPFYQTLKANGTSQPQEPAINFSNQFTLSDTSGIQTNVALAGFTPRTCNSNGCYEIINGTVHEWGHSITIADGSPGTNVCFPFAFPSGVDSAVVSDDLAVGATSTPSVAGLSPSSGASPFPCANSGLWVWGTRSGNAVYWSAWGH